MNCTQLNPLEVPLPYTGIQLIEVLGLPTYWAQTCPKDIDFKTYLTDCYNFGKLLETKRGTLSEDGVYSYPEDPDLHPLVKILKGDEIFYQYDYGLVAIKNIKTGDIFVTRMD